jgi:hypothetical protein
MSSDYQKSKFELLRELSIVFVTPSKDGVFKRFIIAPSGFMNTLGFFLVFVLSASVVAASEQFTNPNQYQ